MELTPQMAGVLALIITTLLSLKRFMASALLQVRRIELTDALKFLAIILIILPLLPNRALDPYGVFNPHMVKSGIAAYLGGWRFGLKVGILLMGATIAGLAVV